MTQFNAFVRALFERHTAWDGLNTGSGNGR